MSDEKDIDRLALDGDLLAVEAIIDQRDDSISRVVNDDAQSARSHRQSGESEMNKTEALKRLDALEAEAAALRQIIKALEPVEKKPLVRTKEKVGYAVLHGSDGYRAGSIHHFRNSFETLEQAEAYAEAFNTILDLRRQPGSEAAEDGKVQWYIDYFGEADYFYDLNMKTERLSPFFDSKESALTAREAVGWDRIKRMYDTLHGRGYE